MNLPHLAPLTGTQVLRFMQLATSALTARNSTDPRAGAECAANEGTWFTDQVINLLLVLFCRLAEAQAETTGLLSHGEQISGLAHARKLYLCQFSTTAQARESPPAIPEPFQLPTQPCGTPAVRI
jgi:hypothetical protein